MKKGLIKTAKISLYSLGFLFVAFVVYANLEPAPMHAYVKPISMTIIKVDGLDKTTNSEALQKQISQQKGVTACTVNPASQLVSITFDPDVTNESSLKSLVGTYSAKKVEPASFDGITASGPECPVPLSYIQAFERAKYAFCFR